MIADRFSCRSKALAGTLVGVESVNVERDDLAVLPEVWVPAR